MRALSVLRVLASEGTRLPTEGSPKREEDMAADKQDERSYLPLIGRRRPVHASDSLPAAASPWVKQVARASPCASMGDAEASRLGKCGDSPSVPSFTPD
jgi:hypothetical protein